MATLKPQSKAGVVTVETTGSSAVKTVRLWQTHGWLTLAVLEVRQMGASILT